MVPCYMTWHEECESLSLKVAKVCSLKWGGYHLCYYWLKITLLMLCS